MKNFFLTSRTPTVRPTLLLGLTLFGLAGINAGCGLTRKPSGTVESLLRTVERGDVERALTFFSNGMIGRRGIGPLKADLSTTALELKEDGGIKSIKVLKEDAVGEVAELTVEIGKGNGHSTTMRAISWSKSRGRGR